MGPRGPFVGGSEPALLAAAPRLKLIQRYGTRPDDIDLEAAAAAGVAVATMPLHGSIAVAELAMTLILALSKNLVKAHAATVSALMPSSPVPSGTFT